MASEGADCSRMIMRTYVRILTCMSLIGRCLSITVVQDRWSNEPLANSGMGMDRGVQVFAGELAAPDYFHEMLLAGNSLILGARNVVYNISLDTFQEISRIEWSSTEKDVDSCQMKQKTKEECQNYIRVIAQRTDNALLVCGTNAFKPNCSTYSFNELNGYSLREWETGVAKCPYDPLHNSTAVLYGQHLYSATAADMNSRDSLIYRKSMRTEQHDSQWLNEPNFVSSFGYQDRVYFFFREMAVENINCGKAVFSRVARVCVNDQGGARVLRHTWTSFFKARLNCSVPGEFPFYFDEIQSTSLVGEGHFSPTLVMSDRVPMIYAVFTTPRNSLRGSAICAFKMSDIVASFEGPFKEQRSPQSSWLPVRGADVPDPHPAKTCGNDSLTFSDQTLNFIKSHPLMDWAVPAFGGQPILVQSNLEYSLTQIAIDWQVFSADQRHYDIMFIGTDNGKVIKAINRGRGQLAVEPTVIEVYSVFENGLPVTGLRIHRQGHHSKLIVMSRDEVRAVPLHRCHLRITCSECVALRDPYCSWVDNKCIHSTLGYQSIDSGRHFQCPIQRPLKDTIVPTASPGRMSCPPCLCRDRTGSRRTQSSTLPTTSATERQTLTRVTKTSTARQSFDDAIDWLNRPVEIDFEAIDDMLQNPFTDSIGPCYGESLEEEERVVENGYSSSMVAVIAVLCTFLSLVVGFVVGFGISWYKFNYQVPATTKSELRLSSVKGIPKDIGTVDNWYDPEPVRPKLQSFSKSSAEIPLAKQQNLNMVTCYVNDLKKNNSLNMANSAVETTLQAPPRRHRAVQL